MSTRCNNLGSSALLLILALSGCGIEGTGSPQAGIEGTGFSDGSVSGFGSVFVNGIEFDTSHAQILINGLPATEDLLRLGMVVSVTGSLAEDATMGVASRVEFKRLIEGPIEAISADGRTVTVLGQTVHLDDYSVIDNVTSDNMAVNDLCAVSGYAAADGSIVASYFQRSSAGYQAGVTAVDITGIVSGLNAGSFQIGGLLVNDAGAAIDKSAGALANGARVEVIGVQTQVHGVLAAMRVTVSPVLAPPQGPASEEGVISQFDGLQDFLVNGVRVNAANAQRMDSAAVLPANGMHIAVQGSEDSKGVLQAQSYTVKPPAVIRYGGRVDSVDPATGMVSMLGVPVASLASTQFADQSVNSQRAFRVGSLQPGDYLDLRVYREKSGSAVATRIERDNAVQNNALLPLLIGTLLLQGSDSTVSQTSGPLDSFDSSGGTLVVAGVAVHTNLLQTSYTDQNGGATMSQAFFGGLKAGDLIEVKGHDTGGFIDATNLGYAR